MNGKILGLVFVAGLAFFVAIYATQRVGGGSKDPAAAQIVDGKYVNSYFNMTIPIPQGWAVASQEVQEKLDRLTETGEAAQKTHQLLMVSEHELGARVDFNPNVMVMAEPVGHLAGMKSGREFLVHTTNMLNQTSMTVEQTGEARSISLGGTPWFRADYLASMPGGRDVRLSYFARRMGDFMLVVILSALDDEQLAQLEAIAASIQF